MSEEATMQRTRIDGAAAVLWASAFMIGALVIVQAGRLPANRAYAEMAVEASDFSLLTTDAGRGEDAAPNELLYVIDSRAETLLIYEIEDARKKQIILRDGANLPVLFRNANR
jgi:hypothetical protein